MATNGFVAESDDWADRGESILQPDILARVKHGITNDGPIVIWHKFYRAARGGEAVAFNEWEQFEEYLDANTHPGDKIAIWYLSLTSGWVEIASGKCPDDKGRTPRLGAY